MENTILILAQGAPAPQSNMLMQMLPFILLMVGFWFLLIQPQRKKQKAHSKMLIELKPGDHVITSGGLCGVITHVKKDRFHIKIDDNTRVDVVKSSITARDIQED